MNICLGSFLQALQCCEMVNRVSQCGVIPKQEDKSLRDCETNFISTDNKLRNLTGKTDVTLSCFTDSSQLSCFSLTDTRIQKSFRSNYFGLSAKRDRIPAPPLIISIIQ